MKLNEFSFSAWTKNISCTHLEEECEWNPLIVAVEHFLLIVVAQTTLRHFCANSFAMLPG